MLFTCFAADFHTTRANSNESTRTIGLDLLSLVSEEFVRPDSPLPSGRRKELKAALIWAMPSVLQVLGEASKKRIYIYMYAIVPAYNKCRL